MSFARLLRTVRPLRPDQLLWRLRYTVERRRPAAGERWAWPGTAAPPRADGLPILPVVLPPDSAGQAHVDTMEAGIVEQLGRRIIIGHDEPDWRLGPRSAQRLWTVTLHYHAWAYALAEAAGGKGGAAERAVRLFRHYVGDWIARCPLDRAGARDLAWNAYAVATRIGWWVRALQAAGEPLLHGAPDFAQRMLSSLWQQASYLADHLEWDLRGNHLMRDLVGLAVAGGFFEGAAAQRWSARAEELAPAQCGEQVLPDGGHFERSPKYQLDVMEDLLTLALLVRGEAARSALVRAWTAAAGHAAWTRHPDGDVALLNDGGQVGAGAVADSLLQGRRLGVSVDPSPRRGGRLFESSGLAVWHGEPWSVFFDVGPPGPDVQPGHGHADNLTLECSFRGERLVVDPGNFGYDDDARRRYDRGTDAHNTLCVDDEDSSEVWGVFRLGRRARPLEVDCEVGAEGMAVSAGHDGYDHLPGRPRHRRRLVVQERGPVRLEDSVEGHGVHRLGGGLLLAPGWRAEPRAGGWTVRRGELRLQVDIGGAAGLEPFVEERPYHPAYGIEVQGIRLGWRWRGALPFTLRTTLAPG